MCFQNTQWDRPRIDVPKGEMGKKEGMAGLRQVQILQAWEYSSLPIYSTLQALSLYSSRPRCRKGSGDSFGNPDLLFTRVSNFLHAPLTPQKTKISSRFTVLGVRMSRYFPSLLEREPYLTQPKASLVPTSHKRSSHLVQQSPTTGTGKGREEAS